MTTLRGESLEDAHIYRFFGIENEYAHSPLPISIFFQGKRYQWKLEWVLRYSFKHGLLRNKCMHIVLWPKRLSQGIRQSL